MEEALPRKYPIEPNFGLNWSDANGRIGNGKPVKVSLPYGDPAWLITGYRDAREAMRCPHLSRSESVGMDIPRYTPGKESNDRPEILLNMDPPNHSELQRHIKHLFTRTAVSRYKDGIRSLADELWSCAIHRGTFDFVADIAYPFSVGVISSIIGIPPDRVAQFRKYADDAVSYTKTSEEQVSAIVELWGILYNEMSSPRGEKWQIIPSLSESVKKGEIDESSAISLILTMLIAGFETTATQISSFTYFILSDIVRKESFDRCSDEVYRRTIHELWRFVPLAEDATAPPRYATKDVQIGGQTIRKGEAVIVNRPSAHRDPTVFDEPNTFNPDRDEVRTFVFAEGIHRCLGSELAELEVDVMMQILRSQARNFALVSENAVTWRTDTRFRGPQKLLLTATGSDAG